MLLVGVTALPSSAAVFSNSGFILIDTSGPATPYPSTISVSGLGGTIVDVNVVLADFSHESPDDVDVLLVGPYGEKLELMTDVGGYYFSDLTTLTFDDSSSNFLPDDSELSSGTYRPTQGTLCNTCGFNGGAPAPAGPYATTLSVFNGTSPNGTWSLYVHDDEDLATGAIVSGWSLDIIMSGPSIDSFNPTSGGQGATVVITGTNLTGATSVTFGGVSSTSFTVDSAARVTAKVPPGAVTGPIGITTPKGTATSAASFTVIPPPKITSFLPAKGQVGVTVVITGTTFAGATEVSFHGTTATVFTVDSDKQITATVPAGAGAGPITVTTAGGTGTSASRFVVLHARGISLSLGNSKAKGTVNVTDGFAACASGVSVRVQHFEDGAWRTVASVLTKASGVYSAGVASAPGRYRAVARATTLSSGDKCMKDVSPTARR
jgi:hypothetical protein